MKNMKERFAFGAAKLRDIFRDTSSKENSRENDDPVEIIIEKSTPDASIAYDEILSFGQQLNSETLQTEETPDKVGSFHHYEMSSHESPDAEIIRKFNDNLLRTSDAGFKSEFASLIDQTRGSGSHGSRRSSLPSSIPKAIPKTTKSRIATRSSSTKRGRGQESGQEGGQTKWLKCGHLCCEDWVSDKCQVHKKVEEEVKTPAKDKETSVTQEQSSSKKSGTVVFRLEVHPIVS